MSVTLFILENNGDHNYEEALVDLAAAKIAFNRIKESGGYWVNDRQKDVVVFIPWHRVEFVRLEENK